MTYGTDLRPASETDWRWISRVDEQDRYKFLSLIRLEIINKAKLRQQLLEGKDDANRVITKFHEFDLVLLRLFPQEVSQLAAVKEKSSYKILPKWSLPYRVIRVKSQGKAAIVRGCLTGKKFQVTLKEVHLQNARIINRPVHGLQQQSWEKIMDAELSRTVFDPQQRKDMIMKFWEDIKLPQSASKRQRVSSTEQELGGEPDQPIVLDGE